MVKASIFLLVDDPKDVADKLGVPIALSGGLFLNLGALWAYLDPQALLGRMIEVKT